MSSQQPRIPDGDLKQRTRVLTSPGSLSAEITIEGSFTRADMQNISLLSGNYQYYIYFTTLRIGLFLTFVAILFCGYSLNDSVITMLAWIGVTVSGFNATFYIYWDIRSRSRDRKQEQQNMGPFRSSRISISNDGISKVLESENESFVGTAKWAFFSGHRLSDTIVLLYHDFPCGYAVIARSMFQEQDDWHSFILFVTARLPVR